jgi:trehalose-phosphatase
MIVIDSTRYRAAIFDLDGVVTRTATVHFQAWAETFNEFLGADQPSFSLEDYQRFVDGKPRYQGVRDFLASRQIELPFGDSSDGPDEQTVCGLGNRKNERFHLLVRQGGVEVHRTSLELIKAMKESGMRVAVVTASKNCSEILEAANLHHLFDAQVDGLEAERLRLRGKPYPETFFETAGRLGSEPAATLVVEDSVAGVAAGKLGGFGLIVAVDRTGHAELLRAAGADLVVTDLAEVVVQKPTALALVGELAGRRLAIFLDYDGTLSAIAAQPQQAVLSASMRSTLQEVAHRHRVAIVSGRDLRDVQQMVGLPELYYAGNHGFEIAGPQGLSFEHPAARVLTALVTEAASALKPLISSFPGVWVEQKRFALAIHYRQASDKDVARVEAAVDRVCQTHRGLRRSGGKKVFEIRPDLHWDKGRAVLWLLDNLGWRKELPLYVGDDVTDEDAFRALKKRGIGICVQESHRPTEAAYILSSVNQVESFLHALTLREEVSP